MARVERSKGRFDLRDGVSCEGSLVGVEKADPRILKAGISVDLLTLFLPQSRISISAAISVSESAVTRRG